MEFSSRVGLRFLREFVARRTSVNSLCVCSTGPATRLLDPNSHGSVRGFSNLTLSTLAKNVVDCDDSICWPVLSRAEEIEKELHTHGSTLPFKKVVWTHTSNPQDVGQVPLQFHGQVLACLSDASLLQSKLYPEEVRERASHYLAGIRYGRIGAYSHPKGHVVFRKDVAQFLGDRDGFNADPEDIFLTDGVCAAVKMVLQLVVGGAKDGVLLPVPQYPMCSSTVTLLGGQSVGYFLDEESGWSTHVEELERATNEFRAAGGRLQAIVVINPGNPTGQVLSRRAVEDILRFAEREGLIVLADEVYQGTVHASDKEFLSCRRVACEIGSKVEVFSFHSASNGVIGDSGLHAGFVHCQNVNQDAMDQMYKLASISSCSNVFGQALMASAARLPPVGCPSRVDLDDCSESLRRDLERKAKMVTRRLNAIDGISCQCVDGAVFAFPNITIKGHVMKKAISLVTPADQIYCLDLLERTGIVAVPGSCFGQKPRTFHIRISILHDDQTLEKIFDDIERFHGEHSGSSSE
eukprot:TRINITY_DN43151_c0_g1_i1.p1 TRINITY_DN43151_c0_g1~~TRINITY_DN43151_c0_g1_i1.p1  ORF type:complete len:522 (+),score=65.46 TRINITY_DN43151_c0_g1_i1:103-1668(+)